MPDPPDRAVSYPRTLPSRANLEHLKNEAKQRLKEMRSQNPAARLADAQLLVARDYGFASWRRLKLFVDALHSQGEQLLQAVQAGDVKAICENLDRHPELVNASADIHPRMRPSDTLTMRVLHLAIAEGKGDVLRLLIERGADVNARNASGRLPLHDCFELGHDDFAQMLFEAGAVPDVCAAAAYGLHDQLEQILERNPDDANDLTTGESPLGWSVYGRQPRSAMILFQYGAIVDRPPYDGNAWRPAAMVASIPVTAVLLEYGADANWRDENGNTPLHRVLESRLVVDPAEFVAMLLEGGADPAARNYEGRTPLDVALLQVGATAETYFPVRPIAAKRLERTIQLLGSRKKA